MTAARRDSVSGNRPISRLNYGFLFGYQLAYISTPCI